MEQNIFELASRLKLRFSSTRGEMTAEQLWDIPLTASNGFSLDCIAKDINRGLKESAEESFVSTARKSAESSRNEIALAVVKRVIEYKIAKQQEAQDKTARAAEREQLLSILAEKQTEGIKQLSIDEIQARLAKLDF